MTTHSFSHCDCGLWQLALQSSKIDKAGTSSHLAEVPYDMTVAQVVPVLLVVSVSLESHPGSPHICAPDIDGRRH